MDKGYRARLWKWKYLGNKNPDGIKVIEIKKWESYKNRRVWLEIHFSHTHSCSLSHYCVIFSTY